MHSFEVDEIDTLYGKNWAVVGFIVRTPNGQITVDLPGLPGVYAI